MATTPSRAEEKARKVHSLLASYYNVEDGSENPSSTKSRRADVGRRRVKSRLLLSRPLGPQPRYAPLLTG